MTWKSSPQHLINPMAKPKFLRSKLLGNLGITAVFSERTGGISPAPYDSLNLGYNVGDNIGNVEINTVRFIESAGLTGEPHQAEQAHGINHLLCSGNGSLHSEQADILLTCDSEIPIAVRTADCMPILIADPVNRVVAAVHAGWRGTAAGVVINAIDQIEKMGAQRKHIHATLGPCIGPCCFEVDNETAEQLKLSVNGADQSISYTPKPHPNLTAINRLQLNIAGVKEAQIETHNICTCCHPERFYSYRRDRGETGRHLAVVALPEAL